MKTTSMVIDSIIEALSLTEVPVLVQSRFVPALEQSVQSGEFVVMVKVLDNIAENYNLSDDIYFKIGLSITKRTIHVHLVNGVYEITSVTSWDRRAEYVSIIINKDGVTDGYAPFQKWKYYNISKLMSTTFKPRAYEYVTRDGIRMWNKEDSIF